MKVEDFKYLLMLLMIFLESYILILIPFEKMHLLLRFIIFLLAFSIFYLVIQYKPKNIKIVERN